MGIVSNTLRAAQAGSVRDKALAEALNGKADKATALAIVYLADVLNRR